MLVVFALVLKETGQLAAPPSNQRNQTQPNPKTHHKTRCGWPVVMLREQYRMHPTISQWPSSWFYSGLLQDGAGVTAATRGASFHRNPSQGPFVVWDCADGRERGGGGGGSLRNDAEARLAAALVAGVWGWGWGWVRVGGWVGEWVGLWVWMECHGGVVGGRVGFGESKSKRGSE